jgi:hypothetical protein
MRMPGTKVILFNAAAVLAAGAALIAVGRSALTSRTTAPCSERYANATRFALTRGGSVVSTEDLQAMLGGKDLGVAENVTVRAMTNATFPAAMTVSLHKGTTAPQDAAAGGMSFPWWPHALHDKPAVCLVYDVLLPGDFDFHRGGTLPGVTGAAEGEGADAFSAPLAWRSDGRVGVTTKVTRSAETQQFVAERESVVLSRGRWVRLEEEVALNAPKKADGVLRVWVDGSLAVDRTNMTYRDAPQVVLSGVAADVFYGAGDGNAAAAAPRDSRISLSPFELRWQ